MYMVVKADDHFKIGVKSCKNLPFRNHLSEDHIVVARCPRASPGNTRCRRYVYITPHEMPQSPGATFHKSLSPPGPALAILRVILGWRGASPGSVTPRRRRPPRSRLRCVTLPPLPADTGCSRWPETGSLSEMVVFTIQAGAAGSQASFRVGGLPGFLCDTVWSQWVGGCFLPLPGCTQSTNQKLGELLAKACPGDRGKEAKKYTADIWTICRWNV